MTPLEAHWPFWNLDEDNVRDLAVGVPGDYGGGSVLGNQGAVWVLFLTPG